MRWFIREYIERYYIHESTEKLKVLDVGSQNVNGTYRTLFNQQIYDYQGLDVSQGDNVDIIPDDCYDWKELRTNFFDVVISGQAIEHIEFPWKTFKEISRVMKDTGICCIIAPSSLFEHRYPIDCYRFYPDGLVALCKYANLYPLHVSTGNVPSNESTSDWDDQSNDSIVIAVKNGHKLCGTRTPQLRVIRRV